MEDLIALEARLVVSLKTLDIQMAKLSHSDQATFHKALMNLMSEHAEHKELIQFIVAINDSLETKNSNFRDLVYDTLKEIIETKRALMDRLIKDLESRKDASEAEQKYKKELKKALLNCGSCDRPINIHTGISFAKVYKFVTSSKLLLVTLIVIFGSTAFILVGPLIIDFMKLLGALK